MRGKKLCLLVTIAGFGVSFLMPARAGCVADCKYYYDSSVETCRNLYDGPHDADNLRRCLRKAKSEYDDCNQACIT